MLCAGLCEGDRPAWAAPAAAGRQFISLDKEVSGGLDLAVSASGLQGGPNHETRESRSPLEGNGKFWETREFALLNREVRGFH